MQLRTALKLGGAGIALVAIAWLARGCYGIVVNKEDHPAAERIVVAVDAYKSANGHYPPTLDAMVPQQMPALPTPRPFGRIGYAPLDGGRGCLIGYFTHRDFLEEYDCAARAWRSLEYGESRLVKAQPVQWLSGPTQ